MGVKASEEEELAGFVILFKIKYGSLHTGML